MKDHIEQSFVYMSKNRRKKLTNFHKKYFDKIHSSSGSTFKHQAWEGGYFDHIIQCIDIGRYLYKFLNHHSEPYTFSLDSVITVLYFHDIEKLFREDKDFDKVTFLKSIDIDFTDEELNALKYIHGEPDSEYNKKTRLMNELAGFCHACDVLSARTFHDRDKEYKIKVAKMSDAKDEIEEWLEQEEKLRVKLFTDYEEGNHNYVIRGNEVKIWIPCYSHVVNTYKRRSDALDVLKKRLQKEINVLKKKLKELES